MAEGMQARQGWRWAWLLLALSVSHAAVAESAPPRWYQVDVVVFRNNSALAAADEKLFDASVQPRWPADIGMLLPAPGETLQHASTRTLNLAWQTQPPQLTLLDFGLDADTYLAAELAQRVAQPRTDTDLGFLRELDRLDWAAPPPETPPGSPSDLPPEPAPEAAVDDEQEELAEALAEELQEEPQIPADWAFRQVQGRERLLIQEVARLNRARDYEVLERLSWRQPFTDDAAASPVMIDVQNEHGTLLGSVSVDLRRFLHTHVELYYRPPDLTSAEGWLHVSQSRRMRSGETHYLDHPSLGVLVRIERL